MLSLALHWCSQRKTFCLVEKDNYEVEKWGKKQLMGEGTFFARSNGQSESSLHYRSAIQGPNIPKKNGKGSGQA